jgi:hypothetical protein
MYMLVNPLHRDYELRLMKLDALKPVRIWTVVFRIVKPQSLVCGYKLLKTEMTRSSITLVSTY